MGERGRGAIIPSVDHLISFFCLNLEKGGTVRSLQYKHSSSVEGSNVVFNVLKSVQKLTCPKFLNSATRSRKNRMQKRTKDERKLTLNV